MSSPGVLCPQGHTNDAESRFCRQCGAAVALVCSNGHPNLVADRFCGQCGVALAGDRFDPQISTDVAARHASAALGSWFNSLPPKVQAICSAVALFPTLGVAWMAVEWDQPWFWTFPAALGGAYFVTVIALVVRPPEKRKRAGMAAAAVVVAHLITAAWKDYLAANGMYAVPKWLPLVLLEVLIAAYITVWGYARRRHQTWLIGSIAASAIAEGILFGMLVGVIPFPHSWFGFWLSWIAPVGLGCVLAWLFDIAMLRVDNSHHVRGQSSESQVWFEQFPPRVQTWCSAALLAPTLLNYFVNDALKPFDPDNRSWGSSVHTALYALYFLAVLAVVARTPHRRVLALTVGSAAALSDLILTWILASRAYHDAFTPPLRIAIWSAVLTCYVAAWGLARRNHDRWRIGLGVAAGVMVTLQVIDYNVDYSGWYLSWYLSWFFFPGTFVVGCLVCWAFDVNARLEQLQKERAHIDRDRVDV